MPDDPTRSDEPRERPRTPAQDQALTTELRAVTAAAWLDILRRRHPDVHWVIDLERGKPQPEDPNGD